MARTYKERARTPVKDARLVFRCTETLKRQLKVLVAAHGATYSDAILLALAQVYPELREQIQAELGRPLYETFDDDVTSYRGSYES